MVLGAKDKLGLRVHGLIVGSPEKKRADPAVLRSLCSQLLPNGKNEVILLLNWHSDDCRSLGRCLISLGDLFISGRGPRFVFSCHVPMTVGPSAGWLRSSCSS